MRKAALVLALLALLVSSVPAAAVVDLDGHTSGDVSDQQPSGQLGIDPDPETTITIHLQRDTDARWVVTTRYELDTANETRAFRTVAEEFEAGELDTGFDAALFGNIANATAERTGREMRVTNVSRESNVSTGTLTLRFTWTNFLERTGDGTLRLGDALWTSQNRTWLSSLGSDQRLVVENPPGYNVPTSNYRIENNTLVFEGPFQFEKRPSVVYEQASTPEPPQQEVPWALLSGGIVLAAAIVAAAYLIRRQGSEPVGRGAEPEPEPEPRGIDSAREDGQRAVENGSDGRSDDATLGGSAGAAGTEVAAEPPEAEESEVDLELLSDEERVEHLLEQNGGRMRQANIVQETGWSDAKVSQLLSSMADDGRVDKLRLGRENLISLPEEENDEA